MENIEEVIGYTFDNKSLLKLALTHSSADDGTGDVCLAFANERLEFLGDSILSIIVAEYIYTFLPDKPEGYLTKLRAALVCEDALYNYALKLNLGERLEMGKGEVMNGGRGRKSILSDAFEALIAAIYLDAGEQGLTAARAFVLPFLPNRSELSCQKLVTGDYKTMLQELIQKNPNGVIYYELTGEKGSAHNKVFCFDVRVNGKISGSGCGKNKKQAQQQAALAALEALGAL